MSHSYKPDSERNRDGNQDKTPEKAKKRHPRRNPGRHPRKDPEWISERDFARFLKKAFDSAAAAIPQEQVDRVLAPILERIRAGEFSGRNTEGRFSCAQDENNHADYNESMITQIFIPAEIFAALKKISSNRKKNHPPPTE